MSGAAKKRMPGPGFWRSLSYGLQFKNDYIVTMDRLFAEYGNYVAFTGGPPVVAVFHPEGIEHVLRKNPKNYTKAVAMQALRPVLGNGLLTSDGEEWKKHRQIIAPEFSHKKVDSFFPVMQRHLLTMLADWRSKDAAFDIAPAISRTTYAIAGECFFGTDLGDTSDIIYKSIDLTSAVAVRRMTLPLNIPLFVPLPKHLRVHKAIRAMNAIVYRILDERTKSQSDAHDVLSRLTKINSESGKPLLSREQIRDEVMTLLLAGHETTGNSLSWTLFLLGKNPEIQNRLRDEVMTMVSGEVPTLSELPKLNYTKMVLEESMRLYPPGATIARQAIADDEIAGYSIAAKTTVNMAQWITHRHPDFWSEPNAFNPERFANPEKIYPFSYFPFAAGPRECVGKNMAMVEAIALLAGMIRNFRFQLVDQNVRIRPLITLRPDPGVMMKVSVVDRATRGDRSAAPQVGQSH